MEEGVCPVKIETIKEIGKRMGQQKGKTYNFYNYKKGSKDGALLSMISSLFSKKK